MGFFDLFKKKENSYSNCKVCNEQILPEFEICYSCKLKDGSQNSVNNNNAAIENEQVLYFCLLFGIYFVFLLLQVWLQKLQLNNIF